MPIDDISSASKKPHDFLIQIKSQHSNLPRKFWNAEQNIHTLEDIDDYSFSLWRGILDNLLEKYHEINNEFNSQFEIIMSATIDNSIKNDRQDIKQLQDWREINITQKIKKIEAFKESYDKTKIKRNLLPASARLCRSEVNLLEHLIGDEVKRVSELKNKIEQHQEFQEIDFQNIDSLIISLRRLKESRESIKASSQQLQLYLANNESNEECKEILNRTQEAQKTLDEIIQKLEDLNKTYSKSIIKEERDITKGLYQEQLYEFTYLLQNRYASENRVLPDFEITKYVGNKADRCEFEVHPILESSGLRCTAAVPTSQDSDPVEIQINFFGTIDVASLAADTEKGGPGQEKLKKYEAKLLEQIESIVQQVSELHPGKEIRLRIAGHSLGGSLAKGFTHTLQRALAVQNDNPENITKKIRDELPAQEKGKHEKDLIKLQDQLTKDKETFKNLNGLKNISGISLYTLGSPGVSNKTDKSGTLLTYYHDPKLLRVYNHFHEEDIIPKYGEAEFLSGRELEPRISTLCQVKYKAALSESEIKSSEDLPFPNITKKVMAAHNKRIYESSSVQTEMTRLNKSSFLSEKYQIDNIKRKIVSVATSIAKLAASFDFLGIKKYAKHEVSKPILNKYREFQQDCKKRVNNLKKESSTDVTTTAASASTTMRQK